MAENTRTSKLDDAKKKFVKFFKDIRNELKRVIWPTRDQLVKSTISVLAICLVIGAVIWVADAVIGQIVGWTLAR